MSTSHYAHAQTPALKTRVVATDLTIPWELVWGPDNQIWMTELRGGVSKVDPTTGDKSVLLAKPADLVVDGEAGLLGMALHPQFVELPFVYIAYTHEAPSGPMVKVVRYRYDGTSLIEPIILVADIRGGVIHNGCRLAFGPDNMLYITTGDTGSGPLAQNVSGLNGKVLRIAFDGSIPEDNPRAGSPVWSWGHRNAQGMTFGPDGTLYISEHGPNTDDEINIIQKGRNYGWPTVRGLCDSQGEETFCNDSNVVEPIGAPWTPTIAPSQLVYYRSALIPEWDNHLVMCTLKDKTLRVLTLSEDRSRIIQDEAYFDGTFGRLRAICVSPDGRVFIGTSNKDIYGKLSDYPGSDKIIEISPQVSDVDDDSRQNHRSGSSTTPTGRSSFTLAGTVLTVSMPSSTSSSSWSSSSQPTLHISDVLGRTVFHAVGGAERGFEVDVSTYPPGLYSAMLCPPSTECRKAPEAFTFVR